MNNFPKISIITPSYNQGEYIEKTIKSILSQEYPNLEYIIIDGGSTDNTIDIIKKYESNIDYWVSEPDDGQSNAINKGFEKSTGDLLIWINSDDWLLPGVVSKIAEAYNANKDCGVFVGLSRVLDSAGKVVEEGQPIGDVTIDSLFKWLDNKNFSQPSSFFTREVWETCRPLDEDLHIAFDLDFWIRIKKKGFNFKVINEILSEELYHSEAKTRKYYRLAVLDIGLVITRHGGEKYVRPYLEKMINNLTRYERNYKLIIRNPLYRFIYSVSRRLFNSDVSIIESVPFRSKKEKL